MYKEGHKCMAWKNGNSFIIVINKECVLQLNSK